MDNSASQSNSLFNSFAPAEHAGRRRPEQNASASQSPGPAYGNSGFGGSSSANTSTQSVAGSTPQLPQKDISLSLLQALLKPQPPPSQTFSASHTPLMASDIERSFSHTPNSVPAQPPPGASAPANALEQLKRMVAAHPPNADSEQPSHDARIHHSQQPAPQGQQAMPPMSDTSDAFSLAAEDAKPASSRQGRSHLFNIDVRKVKLRAKPESVLISLLQQPSRFKPGRLISVSRDFICYAVRSKEGGRIRVIHQFHGQSAKMLGHTDSIVDMAFHPCSREQGMPQILASLGKDNRLVVWLVGSGATEPASVEDAIAYEPFINVDSGEDTRFISLAWRHEIVDGFMELCVGTDMGFMVVKAPVPVPYGKRSDLPNDGLNIIPVATDAAVTAIERAGLRWVIAATADQIVRIYELESHWETSSQPCRMVSELPACEHPIDTLIYIAPATAADGAGHLIVGSQMNRRIDLWWLGTRADQITLIQGYSFVGVPNKSLYLFAKLAWAEQGRCLVATANYLPTGILVLPSSGHGENMTLGNAVGYSLGEEQPTLSLVAAVETHANDEAPAACLSVYSVHTRLVQQLQISGFKPAEHDAGLSDPATLYGIAPVVESSPEAVSGHVHTISKAAPVEESPILAEDTPLMAASVYQHQSSHQAPKVAAAAAAAVVPAPLGVVAGLNEAIAVAVREQLQLQMPGIAAGLQTERKQVSATLDPEAEAKLVDRISTEVERRVTQSVAAAMEQTLIPAYSRATAAMFEQMQSTFESGLHEWWARFGQMMPPPPPPPIAATPLPHMMMMAQPQSQAAVPNSMVSLPQAHAVSMPRPAPAAGSNHIDSLMSILNLQQPQPQQIQQQLQQIQPQLQQMHPQHLMDMAIAAHGPKTNAQTRT
ncbi:hypothetical protein IWW39_003109 [Coemansia spiralis]|uniref:Uncharacterized protein n=1 Tax=Coemansia spiralis TaxID=417178 RepID=A0A9W8L4P2_9FUNG|nr:hypothetical protein IWW39_003109 [Coemansia spiralis]